MKSLHRLFIGLIIALFGATALVLITPTLAPAQPPNEACFDCLRAWREAKTMCGRDKACKARAFEDAHDCFNAPACKGS